MRQATKTALMSVFGALISFSCTAFAQATNDVLIFDNQTDFLLPSYFDAPPQPPTPQTTQQPLVPQNVPSDIDILTEIFGDQAVSSLPAAPATDTQNRPIQNNSRTFYPSSQAVQQGNKPPLLTPLAPLPQIAEPAVLPTKRVQFPSAYATKLLAKETGRSKSNIQLPKDIRLQFPTNSTQLTDSAVKWISAYALHVQKNPTLVVTLRVSNQNWSQQQARLALIMQIMMEKGLPVRQIQIFQSSRDPDTLVIGADSNPNQTHAATFEDAQKLKKEQKTLSW